MVKSYPEWPKWPKLQAPDISAGKFRNQLFSGTPCIPHPNWIPSHPNPIHPTIHTIAPRCLIHFTTVVPNHMINATHAPTRQIISRFVRLGLYPRPQTSWVWWWWWALGQVKIKQTKVYLNWPISLSNGEIYFAFTFPLQSSAVGRCISLLLLVTRPLGPSKSRRRHRETSEGHKMEGMGQLYTSKLAFFLTIYRKASTLLCLCYISQLQDKNRAHLVGELQSAHEASCVDFYKLLKTLAWVSCTPNSIFKHKSLANHYDWFLQRKYWFSRKRTASL